MFTSVLPTPLGDLTITADDEFVTGTSFTTAGEENPNELTRLAGTQLAEYFEGRRKTFDFPFKQQGTDFSQKVWSELTRIPPGKPISYLTLSKKMQNPLAIRAIASANGRNGLVVIVPCHRVIGSDGSLVGFSAGLWRKKWLLEHEAKMTETGQSTLAF